MAGLSDTFEVSVLNALFNNTSLAVANVYVGLCTSDPGESSSSAAAAELTDSGYARKAASFGAPVSGAGTVANDAEVLFNAIADAGSISITHFTFWDAASGGNYIGSGALSTAKGFSQGDVPRFPIGSLVASLS